MLCNNASRKLRVGYISRSAVVAGMLLGLVASGAAAAGEVQHRGSSSQAADEANEQIEVRGATFLTSQSSAPAGMLIADPEVAADAGVEIDWEVTNTAQNSLVALIGGQVDFAYVSLEAALGAVASGEDIVAFVHAGGIATELVLSNDFIESSGVSPDDPIEERFAALEGATIASSALGNSHPAILQARMTALGLGSWADLVEPVTLIDVVAQQEGVRAGQFDGAAWSAGSLLPIVSDGTASVWISVANGDLPEATARPGIIWVARRSWLEENPEAAAGVVAAYQASVSYMNSQGDEASAALKELLFPDMSQEQWDYAFESTLPVFPADGTVTREDWTATIETITANNPDFDLEDVDTDDFVYPTMRGAGWSNVPSSAPTDS